jgi:hypothetical protein
MVANHQGGRHQGGMKRHIGCLAIVACPESGEPRSCRPLPPYAKVYCEMLADHVRAVFSDYAALRTRTDAKVTQAPARRAQR